MAKATIKKPKHVAIAGNIGAGKTTLTEMLSKHYRWIPQFEDVDHNPYLTDFYDDMPRWSFNLQIYFLWSQEAEAYLQDGDTEQEMPPPVAPPTIR